MAAERKGISAPLLEGRATASLAVDSKFRNDPFQLLCVTDLKTKKFVWVFRCFKKPIEINH